MKLLRLDKMRTAKGFAFRCQFKKKPIEGIITKFDELDIIEKWLHSLTDDELKALFYNYIRRKQDIQNDTGLRAVQRLKDLE